MNFFAGYLILINIAAFALMGIDKHKAKRSLWRIPEKMLFLPALLGGSLGAWAGMYFFHHKTRHWYFVVGMPLILAAQAVLAFWIMQSSRGDFLSPLTPPYMPFGIRRFNVTSKRDAHYSSPNSLQVLLTQALLWKSPLQHRSL